VDPDGEIIVETESDSDIRAED
jgi:hypothetical protein